MGFEFNVFDDLDVQDIAQLVAEWLTNKIIIFEREDPLGIEAKASESASSAPEAGGGFMDKFTPSDAQQKSVTLFHYTEITESLAAEYAETTIRGRSQPYLHYANTGINTISFTAKLVAGAQQLDFFHTAEDVWADVMRLKSWLYPDYTQKPQVIPPPTLVLVAGDAYRGVPGIIRSLDFTHMVPFTWDLYPMIVDVSITYEILYTEPVSREHFIDNGMTDSGQASPEPSKLEAALDTVEQTFSPVNPATLANNYQTGQSIGPYATNPAQG